MLIVLFIFGLLIGSFLNVVILRLPEGRKLTGRSQCPHCGRVLSSWELVPVLSYFALGGKCSKCKQSISPRYFIIELVCGLLFMFAGWKMGFGDTVQFLILVKACIISALMVVVFVVDLEQYIILDSVLIVGAFLLVAINAGIDILHPVSGFFHSVSVSSILAACGGSLPFLIIWFLSAGKWMGFGDVKLVFVLGLAVGWPLIWANLFLAFFLGALYSIIPLALGKKTLSSKVPFGTFLSVACLLALYFGGAIVTWYLGLIGWA